jgi:hypothetical protein
MLSRFKHAEFAVVLAAMLSLFGCQSKAELVSGIQPNFVALNPTRILAITPIVISLAGNKESVIDPVILQTMPIIDRLERRVLDAFKGQPAVNGMSFQAVRTSLQKKSSPAYGSLVAGVDGTLSTLRKPRADSESLLGSPCLARKDFVGFYGYCLRQNRSWQKGLNDASAAVLNADAALIVFLTELRTVSVAGKEHARVAVELVLVDTNNADLIWSGSGRLEGDNPNTLLEASGQAKAQWAGIIDALVNESVWQGFPGRKPAAPKPGDAPVASPQS